VQSRSAAAITTTAERAEHAEILGRTWPPDEYTPRETLLGLCV
jgi:hypothetical protein